MMPALGKSVRAVVLAVSVVAVASACGGGSGGGNGGGATQAAPSQAAVGGGDLTSAGGKFGNINSYKFRMELAGGSFDSLGGLVGGGDSFVISGTVIVKPEKAASMDMGGMKIVEVGGKQWMDIGMGSWTESDASGSSLADSFSPETLFSSYVSSSTAKDYKAAGEGDKNGVRALHFVASSDVMNQYGSLLGVNGAAEWTAEVWIAKDGGYPINTTIVAKQNGKDAFKMLMDITNVNDPANKVTAPA